MNAPKAEERWPYEDKEVKDDDVVVEGIEAINDENSLQVTSEANEVSPAVAAEFDPVKSAPPPPSSLCSVRGNCKSDRATVKKVGSIGHFLELLRNEEAAAAEDADAEPEQGEQDEIEKIF